MSWSATAYEGHAQDYTFDLAAPAEAPGGREGEVLESIEEALPALVRSLGDTYVTVTAYGHTGQNAGQPGDTITVSIGSIAKPEGVADEPAADES